MPGGMVTADQVAPPSTETATVPVTWSRSAAVWAVTKQVSSSEQEMSVAPVVLAGRAPSWDQVVPVVAETSATTPPPVDPMATQRPLVRQVTAVRSRIPGGVGSGLHTVPPSTVPMITACPSEVGVACPTAVQRFWSLQAMSDRNPTVGGTVWLTQEIPPLVVAMTAAPLGAPALPIVEPTAQHREALTQSSAPRELTRAGRAAGVKGPSHGESAPKVDGGVVPPGAEVVAQALATITTRTVEATATRRSGSRAVSRAECRGSGASDLVTCPPAGSPSPPVVRSLTIVPACLRRASRHLTEAGGSAPMVWDPPVTAPDGEAMTMGEEDGRLA